MFCLEDSQKEAEQQPQENDSKAQFFFGDIISYRNSKTNGCAMKVYIEVGYVFLKFKVACKTISRVESVSSIPSYMYTHLLAFSMLLQQHVESCLQQRGTIWPCVTTELEL